MSGFLVLTGADGDSATTPDASALDIGPDYDLRVDLALDDWTPASEQAILAKFLSSGDERSYRLSVATDGKLKLLSSFDGTVGNLWSFTSSAATGFTNGTQHWVRVTYDNDAGPGVNVDFYTSSDGSSWDALGTTQTLGFGSTVHAGTALVVVGGDEAGTSNLAAGQFYHALILDGIAGTVVFDADFTDLTVGEIGASEFAEDSSNAATVTINGTGWLYSGLAAVTGTVITAGVTETEVVAGGKTIILTLTGDEWHADIGSDSAQTTALIAGIDSNKAESAGWDAEVKANMVFGDVARTSDTVVTVTLGAESAYAITVDETITVTVPATVLSAGGEVVASPTFTVNRTALSSPHKMTATLGMELRSGG